MTNDASGIPTPEQGAPSWVTLELAAVVDGKVEDPWPVDRVWCGGDQRRAEAAGEIFADELDAAIARIQTRLAGLPSVWAV